jgi:hypothetical protein
MQPLPQSGSIPRRFSPSPTVHKYTQTCMGADDGRRLGAMKFDETSARCATENGAV